MNQELTEQQDVPPTLGYTLQVAREAAGFSIEEIAERLKLSPQQINQLERDDYDKLGPLTFIRGYLKSYCAILQLPAKETMGLFKSPEKQAVSKKMQSFSRRTEKEASDNRLMIISYVILIVTLGASGLWWWQSTDATSQLDIKNTEPALENTEATTAMRADGHIDGSINEQINEDVDEKRVEVQNQAEAVLESRENSGEADIVSDDIVLETQNMSLNTVVDPKASTTEEQALPEGVSTIVMRFSDDCWVEIFDATQERVAFGIKKAGYTMTVQGKAPFAVILNKHLMVDVELDGQRVDLTSLPKNRLAKFKLPLVE
ncbi:RodZ domain-containing protein [Pseudoalteromonas aurantia]|uniref:Cytoskeleton protein RodZ n=1 Tax=Pseudoalteromonas aurantia 208 TaxID=1314867 RepID=A0ABR9E972_9GAMM|nr:RodZ domain-containing protein [Pseudoalteromonas aurantia]MBE0366333.1 cytoskeleton protein RodZ [Pseudoalteromonas aurantia 208]